MNLSQNLLINGKCLNYLLCFLYYALCQREHIFSENQNIDNSGAITKKKGLVWRIKVGVYFPIVDRLQDQETETKLWEIKVILN